MLRVTDGPKGKNDWSHIDWEKEEIWFEESDIRRPLTCDDIKFTHGKYAGYKLSEVSDTWYLEFIKNKNLDDYLIKLTFEKRLGELQ